MKRLMVALGATLITIAVVLVIVVLWYWALHGMAYEIGTATGITAVIFIFVGGILITIGETP